MAEPGDKMTPAVEIVCPFCNAHCSIGYTSNDEPAVVHTLPTCDTFDKLDALDFVVACREKFQLEGAS